MTQHLVPQPAQALAKRFQITEARWNSIVVQPPVKNAPSHLAVACPSSCMHRFSFRCKPVSLRDMRLGLGLRPSPKRSPLVVLQ